MNWPKMSEMILDALLICFFTPSKVRNWEEKLQIAAGEDNVDELRTLAVEQLNVHRDNLPKPGTINPPHDMRG